MDDTDVLNRINKLVDAEHELQQRRGQGKLDPDDHKELDDLEVMLDQCWDLLRQRRARREFGEDPDTAGARPAAVVERYLQ